MAELALHSNVSTHSRPKAAAALKKPITDRVMFQHTAARRRLLAQPQQAKQVPAVSTHSRPKAAAIRDPETFELLSVSTHSRPKAAANAVGARWRQKNVSTHSRPKAAASYIKR